MTQAQCLADARHLKAAMERHGVRCSIELVAGRGPDPWLSGIKWLRMHHHTASRYVPGGNKTPVLALCKSGRSDVPGPLCNGYGGYDLVYRIICMGLANHPGQGGPITIDGVHVPADSARGPTWGTEWEGGFQAWETIPGMLEFMGRADNALAEWMDRPLTSQLEHSTWTPRKIDRLNFSRARGIALTTKYHDAGGPELDAKEREMLAATNHNVGVMLTRVNELLTDVKATKLVVELLWETGTPNGIRWVDPTTGKLAQPGAPGAKPVVDVWRWAREGALQARAEQVDDAATRTLLEQIAAMRVEPEPGPEPIIVVEESPVGGT